MTHVSQVTFDENGEVELVSIVVGPKAYEYITALAPPSGLDFPVTLSYAAPTVAAVFHRAGSVPGTNREHEVASEVFYALSPVVDRLIEYDG